MFKILLVHLSLGAFLFSSGVSLPNNFQSNFIQKITSKSNKKIEYKGKVYFSDYAMLKWEYTSPTQKEVCTNGIEIVVVDHDLEQVSKYLIRTGFNLTQILKKAKPHKKNIYVAKHEGKNYTVQVDSKKRLRAIAYYDELDNTVQISFQNIKYGNGFISPMKMRCLSPQGYDVIR